MSQRDLLFDAQFEPPTLFSVRQRSQIGTLDGWKKMDFGKPHILNAYTKL